MEVIFGVILQALFEAVILPLLLAAGYFLLIVLGYAVALPLLCLVCTPVVLLVACFGPGSYGRKVISGYKGVLAGAGTWGGPFLW